jgi:amidase
MTPQQQAARKAEPAISDIVMMDALPLGRALRAKQLSCVDVMNAYLDHIERFNPKVNAIISMRDRKALIAEATQRDEQLKRGEDLGPLHGMPQAIKDLAATKGILTTQGSPIYKDTVPTEDALIVERARNAGAIIIGKTNVPEFGFGSQTYNPIFGLTRNPYDLTKTSGGSSGGAGVALALRMLPVADGSDHGGSLRNPAAYNNVLGFRTSYGRVPHFHEDVFLTGLSVKGPMARTVADLQMLLSVQAGYDDRVPLSIADPHTYAVESLKCDVKGKRIGWLGEFGNLPMEAGVRELCREALRTLESMGCIVEEVKTDFDAEAIWKAWITLRSWTAGAKLRPHYDNPKTRDLLKPAAQWEVEEGYKLSAFDIVAASEVRNAWYREVRKLFQRYDYMTLPSASVFPFPVETNYPTEIAGTKMDTYHRWMQVVIPITMSGCPSLSIPVGFNAAGLPMGMQIVGPMHAEHAVMQLANAYEGATNWTKKVLPPILSA